MERNNNIKREEDIFFDDHFACENIMGDDFDDLTFGDIFKGINFKDDLKNLNEIFDEVWGTHKKEEKEIQSDKENGSITMDESEVCSLKSEIKKDIDLVKLEFVKNFEKQKKEGRTKFGGPSPKFVETSRDVKEAAILVDHYKELETPLVLNAIMDNEPVFSRMKMEYVPIIHYSKTDLNDFILKDEDTLIPLCIKDMQKGNFHFELLRQLLKNLIDYNIDIERVSSKMGFKGKDGTDGITKRISKAYEFMTNMTQKLRQNWIKNYSQNKGEKFEEFKRIYCFKDIHPFHQVIKKKFSFLIDEVERIIGKRYYLIGDDVSNFSAPSTFKYGQELTFVFEETREKLIELRECLTNLIPFIDFSMRSNISIRYIQDRHISTAMIDVFGFSISFVLILKRSGESRFIEEYFKNTPTYSNCCLFDDQFYCNTDYLLSILSYCSTVNIYNQRTHYLNKRLTRKFAVTRLPKGCENHALFKKTVKEIDQRISETINAISKPKFIEYPNLTKYYNLVLFYCKHGEASEKMMSRMGYYLNNDLLKLDDYMGDFDSNMPIEHLSLRFFKSVASDYILSAYHYYNKCFRYKQNCRQLRMNNEKFCYYMNRFNNFAKENNWGSYKESVTNEIFRKQSYLRLFSKLKIGEIPFLSDSSWISDNELEVIRKDGSKFNYLRDKLSIPINMLKTDENWRKENLRNLIMMDYDIENDDFEKDFKSIDRRRSQVENIELSLEDLMKEALDENIINSLGFTNSLIRDQVSKSFDPDG